MHCDDWLLTPWRAAIHRPTQTAVIADVHLGYDHARRHSGEAIPCFGIADSLAQLATLAKEYAVHRLVVAGDLLENGRQGAAVAAFLAGLHRLGLELVAVVPGNHDRKGAATDQSLPIHAAGVTLGRWQVRHGDQALPRTPTIHGHVHPCLRLHRRLAVPCYLTSTNRIMLPAFSADAAGVDVLHQRSWQGYRCYVIAGPKVLDFGILAQCRRRLGWRGVSRQR